jgi:hypothetical protein
LHKAGAALGGRFALARFLDETGDRIGGLSAFAQPILGALEINRKIVALL